MVLSVRYSTEVPENKRYQCAECEFMTLNQSYLKQHTELKHKGIRFPCEHCAYAATATAAATAATLGQTRRLNMRV